MVKRRPITKQEVAIAMSMRKLGKRIREIAQRLDKADMTISRALNDRYFKPRKKRKKQENISKLIDYWLER